MSTLIARAEEFVKNALKSNDASHDWEHIDRVRNLALRLAVKEGVTNLENLCIIELAALLHDVQDWKYKPLSEQINVDSFVAYLVGEYATELTRPMHRVICYIVDNIGFKSELGDNAQQLHLCAEAQHLFNIVQDSDRLDALGAIGIARCFTFGATKGRPLYNPNKTHVEEKLPSQEQYVASASSEAKQSKQAFTIDHFYEKLLHLKNLMKTEAGKAEAQMRHEFMQIFLQEFWHEVGCGQ